MEHFHLEVFVNEGGRVTIRQESPNDAALVIVPLEQLPALIKALKDTRRFMLENGINATEA